MTIMSCGTAGCGCRCVPSAPLVVDPAEPVTVETLPVGPGGKALAPVLILPGGLRVYVDAFATDADAAGWWENLGTAALYAALCYQDENGSAR